MKVHVRVQDIELGSPGDAAKCPIALSISRTLGPGYLVSVTSALVVYVDDCQVLFAHFPESAKKFIHDFDQERPVKTFSFDL